MIFVYVFLFKTWIQILVAFLFIAVVSATRYGGPAYGAGYAPALVLRSSYAPAYAAPHRAAYAPRAAYGYAGRSAYAARPLYAARASYVAPAHYAAPVYAAPSYHGSYLGGARLAKYAPY